MVRTYDPKGFKVNSRRAQKIADDQETAHAQGLLTEGGKTITPGVNAPVGYDLSGLREQAARPSSLTAEDRAAQNNAQLTTPKPAATTGGTQPGVIEQTRTLRQGGFDSTVDANGNVVASGGTGPVATTKQVDQNAANLKGIMNARPLTEIAKGPDAATVNDLKGAGLQTINDVIGRGVETVEGTDYLINEDGSRTKLSSDWKDQYAQEEQRAEEERQRAEDAAKAQQQEDERRLALPSGSSAKPGETPNAPTAPTPSQRLQTGINSAASKMLVGALPPGYEFLAPAYQEALGAYDAGAFENADTLFERTSIADEVFAGKMSVIQGIEAGFRQQFDDVAPMLGMVLREKLRAQDEAKKAAEDYIDWQKEKDVRTKKREAIEKVTQMNAELAISGGFGSSNGLSEIREEQDRLEQIADDAAREWDFKKIDVGIKITEQHNAAWEDFATKMITAEEKLADKLAENEARKLTAGEDRGKAYDDAIKDYQNDRNTARRDHAQNLRLIASDVMKIVGDERSAKAKQEEQIWDRALQYVDRYGTQNRPVLQTYERALGLAPGALSNQQTLEELRMRKASGTGLAGGDASTIVEDERARIKAMYPGAPGSLIDNLVYATLASQFGNDQKGRPVLRQAYAYMSTNPVNGESYRVQPFLTAAQGAAGMDDNLQQLDDYAMLSDNSLSADDLFAELTDSSLPAGQRMTSAQAENYLGRLGYVRMPSWYLPRSWESFGKLSGPAPAK